MKHIIAFAAALLLASSAAHADIYISYSDFGDGNSRTNTDATFTVGDSGSAFVWVSIEDGDIDTGVILDVLNSNTSVVAFTAGEVFDPAVTVGGSDLGDNFTRWLGATANGTAGPIPNEDVAAGQITRFQGFALPNAQTGLRIGNQGPVFVDTLYDATEDAYLFGRFDFDVVGEGTASFSVTPSDGDPGNIVHAGGVYTTDLLGATLTANAIPEPTSAAILAMGLIGLVSRRRR